MLASNSAGTPRRPLPPAKARKSTSLHFGYAPPPPYAPLGAHDEILLDSPITVTTQLVNAASQQDGIGLPNTPGVEDWMNEKSREELSGLLLKADGIIKSREEELGLTSALCKTLYSDNVTLKTKHEALLARIPGTRGSTPTTSRPSSPFPLDSPGAERLQSFSAVLFPPSSPSESTPSRAAVDRIRRTRRISFTPAELASLSDQNAELIDKLEQLETESVKADQAGKRKLRKLEQEIQTLRDELDRTQARGVELEAQAKAAVNAVTAQKRKEEREAKLQALKDRCSDSDGVSPEEARDFAPPSELSGSRATPLKRSTNSSLSSTAEAFSSGSEFERLYNSLPEDVQFDAQLDEQAASYFPSSDPPANEYAIVSQLLEKIRELEETNAQIKEQQKATENRMRAAQWDAESIRRVYDCLDDDDVDLEIQEEDEGDLPRRSDLHLAIPPNDTIRFSSLRRSIDGDVSRLMASESDIFAQGITQDMRSTMRRDLLKPVAGSKARKTVVGLFDSDADNSFDSDTWEKWPSSLKVSPAFRSREDADTSVWSSSATDGLAPFSPAMSAAPTSLDIQGMGRTLGSELGSEFGDDWAERGINHHLRASSLADLAGLYSSPASPTSPGSILPPISVRTMEPPKDQWSGSGPSTPPRASGLQLKIEPPTPTPDKLLSPAGARQLRLSQTVRARTSRWVEGRFPSSFSPNDSMGEMVLRNRPSSSTLGRRSVTTLFKNPAVDILSETFDQAVGKMKRFGPMSVASLSDTDGPSTVRARDDVDGEEDVNEEADKSLSLRRDTSVADPLAGKHDGFVGFVLEAWLWLQFAVVVALFLWAMAKRGPKVVLEAERRSAANRQPRS